MSLQFNSRFLDFTKIIVIAGLGPGSAVSFLSNVEVINLSDESEICPQLPDYPIALEDHTAAFYQGKIVSCGGYDRFKHDECFELGPDLREWVEIPPLPIAEMDSMKSSVIDQKWVISGGSGQNAHASLQVYDGIFTPSPNMPFEKFDHCQLTLNSTHIFFTAGYGDRSATFMLNWPRQEWIILDDMHASDNMINPACGFVKSPSLGQEIIIAGDTTSLIFSMTDLEWREGPLLPEDLADFTNLQLNNEFLAIGGMDNDVMELDTIYRFDPDIYDWVLEPQRLKIPRRRAAAVAVPDDFLDCN